MSLLNRTFRGLLAALALGISGHATAATLDLQLLNLRPDGEVRVEVYDNAASWRRGRDPLQTHRFQARNVTQQLQIAGLAPGQYAVRLWQASSTGGLGRWPPQMVLARQGYSRHPLSRRRAPSFENAAVALAEAGLRLRVRAHLAPD